ncbi:unnamed protein product [Meloidogyne enterolobii]|uniref:Uncharacterized protein n=1 Tax=Meloidogyne enterolobii TaxID=390850 RepID=A0ACB0Y4Z8_MELEN
MSFSSNFNRLRVCPQMAAVRKCPLSAIVVCSQLSQQFFASILAIFLDFFISISPLKNQVTLLFYMYFLFKSEAKKLISIISLNRFPSIKRIFSRLGMDNNKNDNIKNNSTTPPKFTVGYLFANPDTAISSIKVGENEKKFFT